MSSARPPEDDYGIAPPGYRLPPDVRLGPVRLQIADLERSMEFYRRVLGLAERAEGDGRASLGAPGADRALVELVERPGVAPATARGRLGLYHFAILVPERAALGRLAMHLNELGVRVGSADHLVSQALYLSDPDGLGIEVYRDRPRSRWRARDRQLVMTTEPLDLNGLVAGVEGEPFRGLPSTTTIGHVHLHVGALDEAARFYHEALGFDRVVWDYPGALFLSAGGYHHHVGTNAWAAHAKPVGPDDAKLLSWTLVLPRSTDVERAAESLTAAGYSVTRRSGERLAEDPWGTRVRLVALRDVD